MAYQLLTPANGFTIAINSTLTVLVPAVALTSGTLILPANPTDGQICKITTTQTIVQLKITPSVGSYLVNVLLQNPFPFFQDSNISLMYVASLFGWVRIE